MSMMRAFDLPPPADEGDVSIKRVAFLPFFFYNHQC
jgi:hypothetical protein